MSRIREYLTPGTVLGIFALVLMMGGGAYAASHGKTLTKAQVIALVKQYAKAGPPGPAGPAGPAGNNGTNGKDGAPGSAGTNGKSVLAATLSPGQGGCPEGGVSVEVEGSGSKKSICNGEEGPEGAPGTPGIQGPTGPEGSPWTAGGVLPKNSTETGSWSIDLGPSVETGIDYIRPIASFPIPLSAPLPTSNVHFIGTEGKEVILGEEGLEEVTPTECGSAIGANVNAENPQAKPGNLCVYAAEQEGETNISNYIVRPGAPGPGLTPGASTSGAAMYTVIGSERGHAYGTWAVTGE